MTDHEHPVKILAFVGLTGSGKSSAVDYVTAKGYPKVYFGGVILDAMTEAGLEHTQENEKPFREEYRAKYGKDAVANKIVEQIKHLANAGQHRIIADGLYSWTEYKILKHAFPGEISVVAVLAPRHIRHHRLANRLERPFTAEEAKTRDWTEIEHLEKGGPIAMADHFIINDHDISAFDDHLDKILNEIEFF